MPCSVGKAFHEVSFIFQGYEAVKMGILSCPSSLAIDSSLNSAALRTRQQHIKERKFVVTFLFYREVDCWVTVIESLQ